MVGGGLKIKHVWGGPTDKRELGRAQERPSPRSSGSGSFDYQPPGSASTGGPRHAVAGGPLNYFLLTPHAPPTGRGPALFMNLALQAADPSPGRRKSAGEKKQS